MSNDTETDLHLDAAGVVALAMQGVDLVVTEGPDRGRALRVEDATCIVGSDEGADLRLTDTTISREHIRLSRRADGVLVRDPGSKNGTWLGGARITELLLTESTALRLGKTLLSLTLHAEPTALTVTESARFGDALGVAPATRHVFATLLRAAKADVSLLLEGESGVGKDVLARAVHEHSNRANGPFVAVDCGAIPAGLIESELFGHERGAFTGAEKAREGVFVQAHGGTLFLDEIGELPVDMQPKLLRALEQREVRPVGGRGTRSFDIRVVAATNRKLQEAVLNGTFRQDLYYRLAGLRVVVPALRDRPEDILPLAEAFYRRFAPVGQDLPRVLASMLQAYSWPGNVRELKNVVERYAVIGAADSKLLFDRPAGVASTNLSGMTFHEARAQAIDSFERIYLPQVLAKAGGIVTRAAELAGVTRPAFHRMLQRIRGREQDD